MSFPPASRFAPRSGTALIIAILILAGLLILGVPFLFSQSESLAGTRSYAQYQAAALGLSSGEQAAAAIVADNIEPHLTSGIDRKWTNLAFKDATTANLDVIQTGTNNAQPTDAYQMDVFALDLGNSPADPGRDRQAHIGASIQDEYGKLNPNYLSAQAWDILLKQLNIIDWDDNAVDDSQDLRPEPKEEPNDRDDDDGNDLGELAEALALLREQLPDKRITSIDQLLLADPGHNEYPSATFSYPIPPNANLPGSFGFRRPLTRMELERLRPCLTLYTPAPGRDGRFDVGSMLLKQTIVHQNGTYDRVLMDSDVTPAIRRDSIVVYPNPSDNGRHASTYVALNDVKEQGLVLDNSAFAKNLALVGIAPPPVNVNEASQPVLATLSPKNTTFNLPPRPITSIKDIAAKDYKAYKALNPLSSGYDLPPLGIASMGVVSISASAAAPDQIGRIASQRERTSVIQAVPSQSALGNSWLAQEDWEALSIQRWASQMVSWPKAMLRVNQEVPSDVNADGSLSVAPLATPAVGYPQKTLGKNEGDVPSFIDIDFKAPLGAQALTNKNDADLFKDFGDGTTHTGASATNICPEGVKVTGTFAWKFDNTKGPLRPISATDSTLQRRHLSFWFSPQEDWGSDDSIYPLLECRSPEANLGAEAYGNLAGSNERQNLLGIYYDRTNQVLVASYAPPIIEHTQPSGTQYFSDQIDNTFHLDERCLGIDSAENALYNLVGGGNAEAGKLQFLAPAQKEQITTSSLFVFNRISHLYKVPDRANLPYFRKGQWYHLNVVLAGTNPGEVVIILDQIVGQDRSRTPPSSFADMNHGDHLSLPAMNLRTAIAGIDHDAGQPLNGGAEYILQQIEVDSVLGLTAEELFPDRGFIRIDDEYFSYATVDGNIFTYCQRARRQNSMTQTSADPKERWPLTQEHLAGALVVPGGYRITPGSGNLYRGGCTLAYHLGNGAMTPTDPNPSPWLIYTHLDLTALADTTSPPPLSAPEKELLDTDATITLTDTFGGVSDQFPTNGGIIVISGGQHYNASEILTTTATQYIRYSQRAGLVLSGLEAIDPAATAALEFQPIYIFPPRIASAHYLLPATTPDQPRITLVGFPLTAANPLHPGRYRTEKANNELVMQLQHPTSGRVEWLRYETLAALAGADEGAMDLALVTGFMLNRGGFGLDNRGQQRTDFVGKTIAGLPATTLTPQHFFPADPALADPLTKTMVIPVQMDLGNQAHYIESGDIVTITYNNLLTAPTGSKPIQATVRYAATDGLNADGVDAVNDTKNEYFAFDGPLPDYFPQGANANYSIAAWPGNAGRDLTPMSPASINRSTPLRLDIASDGADPAVGGSLAIASPHSNAPSAPIPGYATTPAIVDAFIGGKLRGFNTGSNQYEIDHGIRYALGTTGELYTGFATVGNIVVSNENLFKNDYGLIVIDGETFAYRQLTQSEMTTAQGLKPAGFDHPNLNQENVALLIARGVLDVGDPVTQPNAFQIPLGPNRGNDVLRPYVSAIPLPMGPVAQFTGAVTDHALFTLNTGIDQNSNTFPNTGFIKSAFKAPRVLVCKPDGTDADQQVIFITGGYPTLPNKPSQISHTPYITAPWLRGEYGTRGVNLPQADDIAIGWWPRYPSALPNLKAYGDTNFESTTTNDDDDQVAMMRSRHYPWVSLPMAMHHSRLDAALSDMTIDSTTNPISDLVSIEVRVMSKPLYNWLGANVGTDVGILAGGKVTLSTAIANCTDISGKEVNGAEVRVHWRYVKSTPNELLTDIAEAGNRAPRFTEAHLRWRAPMAILAVEEAH